MEIDACCRLAGVVLCRSGCCELLWALDQRTITKIVLGDFEGAAGRKEHSSGQQRRARGLHASHSRSWRRREEGAATHRGRRPGVRREAAAAWLVLWAAS